MYVIPHMRKITMCDPEFDLSALENFIMPFTDLLSIKYEITALDIILLQYS